MGPNLFGRVINLDLTTVRALKADNVMLTARPILDDLESLGPLQTEPQHKIKAEPIVAIENTVVQQPGRK